MNQGEKRKRLRLAVILLAFVAVTVMAAGILYWNSMLNLIGDAEDTVPTLSQEEIDALLGSVDSTETLPATEATFPEETEPAVQMDNPITNIMLVGQNFREDEQNKLSDTMILCAIIRKTIQKTMVSFLRDLYVPLPAYAGHGPGRNRINVCYALGSSWTGTSQGGMEMLALCIEQNFGIHVDHTIEVGFETFTNIIDSFGGIGIEVTEEEAAYMTESVGYVGEIQPGYQTLYGLEALAYARIRKIDGDRQRAARQRAVITALVEKCRSMSLTDMHNMAKSVLPYIITDMTNQEITGYLLEFLPMLKDLELRSLTCPVENSLMKGSMWGKPLIFMAIHPMWWSATGS